MTNNNNSDQLDFSKTKDWKIEFVNYQRIPKLGKYRSRETEEIVELDNLYLNNLGVWYGMRWQESYSTAQLTNNFWNEFEEIENDKQ